MFREEGKKGIYSIYGLYRDYMLPLFPTKNQQGFRIRACGCKDLGWG